MIGREAELGLLESALDQAPATVVIAGEAGVGKTRLVEAFLGRHADQVRVLRGGCLELGLPFGPFTAVLRGVGSDEIGRLVPRGGELGRLLPAIASPGDKGGELARARLFEQVLRVLSGLADRTLLVVVLEDVHWADRSSRDLLRFLVRNQQDLPGLLVIATYRTDQVGDGHPLRGLLTDLVRLAWVRRVELRGLSRDEVRRHLRQLSGQEPNPENAERIYRRSEGNPLFVETLAGGDPVPGAVRDLLIAPFRALPEPAREAVRAAAIGGHRVGHALLAAVTGMADDTLRPAVAANVMVVDGDGYRFRHALIGEVVRDDLLPGERSQLHVRYAEALERDPALAQPGLASVQIAHHWHAVAGKHGRRAITAAWRAAADAGAALAYAEQLAVLSQVLDLWERMPDAALGTGRGAVLELAVAAAVAAGEGRQALELIDDALSVITEPGRVARLLRHRGEVRHTLGLAGDLDDLREAAALDPDPLLLNALANRLLTIPRDDEGRSVSRRAIAAARASGDERSELLATINLAYAEARAGDLDAQLLVLVEARRTAERLGDHGALLHALRCMADLLQDAGRHRETAEVARSGLAAAARAGLARTAGPTHAGNLAEALISLGHWDEALEIIEHALEPEPAPSLRAYLLVLRATITLARGDLELAETVTGYAREVFLGGTCYAQDYLLLTRLELDLLLANGKLANAARCAARVLATIDPEEVSPRYLWPVLAAGARAGGETLAGLRKLADTLPVIGPVQRAHARTFAAELTGDLAAWDECARAWAALGQPYSTVVARLRAAEVAAEEGRREAVAERLRAVAPVADELAAPPLRAEVDRLSRLARVTLAAQREQDRLRLTPRELEVLALVAEGRTNRQIAEELFISIKTASVHVSNILSKLGVSGRVQAATAAHRLNLLEPG